MRILATACILGISVSRGAAGELSMESLERRFRELPPEARRLTGPLFWLHGDESGELLESYVARVAEGGNGCFTAESRPDSDWLGEGWYRDLGILLFVAETGVAAGGSPISAAGEHVWAALGAAVLVTAVPVAAGVWFGRRVLRLRAVDAWGGACGGMTSSAALVALRRAADSNEPALSYAASYTVASVLVTVAGSVVVLLAG